MRLIFVLLSLAWADVRDRDVSNGLQMKNGLSDSVHFKFKLGRSDKPSLALVTGPKFIPLRVEIDGRSKRVQCWSTPPGQRPIRRGRAVVVRELSNLDRENEMVVSFNKRIWTIEINGVDVTDRFKPAVTHNGNWKKVRRVRAKSKKVIRRLTVTINQKIPEWEKLNHDQCGYHYKLAGQHYDHMAQNFPLLVSSINIGKSTFLDTCQAKNAGIKFGESRIVGGQASPPGYYPWLTSLRLEGTLNPHQCGASLINRCWLISAAHCFPRGARYEQKYTARIGDYHNSPEDDEKWSLLESVHESKLKQVVIYRGYNSQNYENDIALIELEDCVPSFNQFRSPICLPTATKQHDAGECCHIHGWGKTASDSSQLQEFIEKDRELAKSDPTYERIYNDNNLPKLFPTELQMATNYIETDQECQKFYPKTYKKKSQLCASHELKSGIAADTCQGDSGGPLACVQPTGDEDGSSNSIGTFESNERYTLWGVTSYGLTDKETGRACSGTGKRPGVYTKVANFMDFIAFNFDRFNVDPNA